MLVASLWSILTRALDGGETIYGCLSAESERDPFWKDALVAMRGGTEPKGAWEAGIRKADAENGVFSALDEKDRACAGEVFSLFQPHMQLQTRASMRIEAPKRLHTLEERAEEAKRAAREKARVCQTLGLLLGAGLGILLL